MNKWSPSAIIFILTNIYCIQSCEGVLESVKETLDGLKSYAGEILPYIQKGVKMVQQADKFVDNAIGEDCTYECAKEGYEAIPRSGHVRTSNGCGAFDFIFDDTPESLIHVEKEFQSCCSEHDKCYDTCNMDKDDCDLSFKRCLYGFCKTRFDTKKKHLQYFDKQKCKLKAKIFYVTVVGVGCQAYQDAQQQACRCVKILEKPRPASSDKNFGAKDEM